MQTESAAYLIGRQTRRLAAQAESECDAIFAAERVDGETLAGRTYEHCTFANISFLEAEVTNCSFEDCVFIGCYFRKTLLRSVEFKGCDFPRVRIHSSRFGYCQFHDCVIDFDELRHNLPPEPNIRRDLTANLGHAAESLGLTREARRFRLEAIDAHNKHLWAGVKHQSDWDRDHFPGIRRVTAFLEVIASRLNGLLWGHGERWGVLVFNFAVLAFFAFPILLLYVSDGIVVGGGRGLSGWGSAFWLSVSTILPVGSLVDASAATTAARSVLALEAFSGLVIGGLVVTLVFRAIMRR